MELDNTNSVFSDKFEELNIKITSLQDIILKMKVDFDLMTRNQFKNDINSQLINTTGVEMNKFLDNRPSNCKVITPCTTKLEKTVMEFLRLFSEQNYKEAFTYLNSCLSYIAHNYSDNDICQDKSCLENAKNIYITLRSLLDSKEQINLENYKNKFTREFEHQLSTGNEKEESALMSALGNPTRIKILKELSKGNMLYTQLERKLGLKGGHFHFHLNNLIKTKFIIQEKEARSYSITTSGLKALKFLFELSKESVR